jgi:hypothetical protein
MVGDSIDDPDGVEGPPGCDRGLGLLPVTTEFRGDKVLDRPAGAAVDGPAPGAGEPVRGYRIHHGRVTPTSEATPWLTRHGDDLAPGSFGSEVLGDAAKPTNHNAGEPDSASAHGPTTGGADSAPAHGPTTGGADSAPAHGPTTGGADSAPAHGPTTGGADSAPAHGPTTPPADTPPVGGSTTRRTDSTPADGPTTSRADTAPASGPTTRRADGTRAGRPTTRRTGSTPADGPTTPRADSTPADQPATTTAAGEVLGWHAGRVLGTTLHGLFENDGLRAGVLAWAADRAGKRWAPSRLDFAAHRLARLDRMADTVEAHLDLDRLRALIAEAAP